MATHGTLSEFIESQEPWTTYIERLEQYFAANDVAADAESKRRAILLSSCGTATYQLIRNLLAPSKPAETAFKDIVKAVTTHYNPNPSQIVERFKFNSRIRRQGETIAAFVADLRRLTEHCGYGATLDEMIRDRLVSGIADLSMQRRLLSEADLTLPKAIEIAQTMEAAERDAQELQQPLRQSIHAVPDHGQQSPPGPAPMGRKQPIRRPCYRCGGPHRMNDCRFKEATCHKCGKVEHIAKVCRSGNHSKNRRTAPPLPQQSKSRNSFRAHTVAEGEERSEESESTYDLYHLNISKSEPIRVTLSLNRAKTVMEVDTGASVSIVSEATYRALWQEGVRPPLRSSPAKIQTYTGGKIAVVGEVPVTVQYEEQTKDLTLLVVQGRGPSLVGRNWLHQLKLNWQPLFQVRSLRTSPLQLLNQILHKRAAVFRDELGTLKGVTATIHVEEGAHPRYFRPRPVPYALRPRVEQELERLQRMGVIEPVQFSEWAAPIVPVVKKDGSIRICGDYKLTVNQAAKNDTFPLPRIEDIFASLEGGQVFTKLDLAHAYQQVPLADCSKQFVTINTSRGLFQYNRLPFGVAAAPSIFQRTMETLLHGIPHCSVYLDDILITGNSEQEHLRNLDAVLERLEEAGMRLKKNKCKFMIPEVEYLGHKISRKGLQPTEDKVRAIANAPPPTNVSQLKSFLGLVNYYGKFLPNLSTMLAPLYALLQKTTAWSWGTKQEAAFMMAKSQLTSSSLLVHYSSQRSLILACDASPYGVGAVLSHRMDDGSEKPIAFASRSLSPAEKGYAQLDKEALAIIFGVTKFRQYLLGRTFTIQSDHKPLMYLFGENKGVPAMASARIQRWALTLSAYQYVIQYKKGGDHANADSLSRLPLPDMPQYVPIPGDTVLLLDALNSSPVTVKKIRLWTDRDPLLSRVREYVSSGWHSVEDKDDIRPYLHRKDSLSVEDGCILWGRRVVVPPAGYELVLDQLHSGHPGITRMKSLARSYVWWPGLEAALEDKVKSCVSCQQNQKSPPPAPLHPWEWPEQAWSRIHVDYAGPFLGKMFLILVDAHSKWMEVCSVSSATSQVTISELRKIFATHGLPQILVSHSVAVIILLCSKPLGGRCV